ncbi:MAG: glycerophosphodiester phosphodiesterase [Lachnospiraceae bacterium]|nr:glycerophosphodiester phosphodiesterase [Lachnospiraceae bacterium]
MTIYERMLKLKREKGLIVQAHRGASAYAPENTIPSFALALEMGADAIELDIHLTADGKLAVNHDGNLNRCGGVDVNIRDKTMEELLTVDMGYAAKFGDKYKGTRLPELHEVFELIRGTGMIVNVELKDGGGEELIRKAVETELSCGMDGFVLYSSFNHGYLDILRSIKPDSYTAPLYGAGIGNPWNYAATRGDLALHPQFSTVDNTPDYCENCHKYGVMVNVWTVDGVEDMKRLWARNCDSVITNVPDIALKVRNEA